MSKILSHSDEVSGITVLNDGTEIYWTEGRGSWVVIQRPTGVVMIAQNATHFNDPVVGPILLLGDKVEERADEYRTMTPEEEARWELLRKHYLSW